MSEISIELIRSLAKNYHIFDLKAALALKVKEISQTDLDEMEILENVIEETNKRIEEAERNYDLNRAADLKYGLCEKYNKQLEKIKLKIIDTVNNLFPNFPSED
ncbi:MAG: hypothetical protein F6K58_05995 [Symploca sp. SIO2E9]|nr:hypothetical protein [Symploca sp. SIO2E9]